MLLWPQNWRETANFSLLDLLGLFKSGHLPSKICKRADWKRKIIHCFIQAEGQGWIAVVMKWCWSGKARELQLAERLCFLPYCFAVPLTARMQLSLALLKSPLPNATTRHLYSQIWSRKMLNKRTEVSKNFWKNQFLASLCCACCPNFKGKK